MGTIQQLAAALWLWGGHEDTPGEAYALPCSRHSVSASSGSVPTVIFSPWPIIGPGLWHICWADGQEGHFSMSVKPEGDCRVLGRIAQVHWPPGSQTQGEGRGQTEPQEDPEGSQHVRRT